MKEYNPIKLPTEYQKRYFYFCENCESVHIKQHNANDRCPFCNGEIIALDGLQSSVQAIMKDNTICVPFSMELTQDITSRPFMGWTTEGHKNLKKM